MIHPGSAVAFALVFVVSTWATSAALGAGLLASRRRLVRLGSRAERRAAAIAIAVPPVVGLILTGALAGFSWLGPALGSVDHCLEHPHHLHLCLRHGQGWLGQSWAVALVAGLGAYQVVGFTRAAYEAWSARRSLRTLRAVSRERRLADSSLVCAPSGELFCFTAGLWRPRIYVSTAALGRIGPAQLRAALAHERAHIAGGDLWRGGGLAILALFGMPGLAGVALRMWRDASEKLCDRIAADHVGSPEPVASAILAFAGARVRSPGCALIHHRARARERIEAVLAGAPLGGRAARRLGTLAGCGVALVAAGAVLLSDPLHHAIETVLGSL